MHCLISVSIASIAWKVKGSVPIGECYTVNLPNTARSSNIILTCHDQICLCISHFSGDQDHPFAVLEGKGLETGLELQMPIAASMAKGWLVDG